MSTASAMLLALHVLQLKVIMPAAAKPWQQVFVVAWTVVWGI